MSYFAYNRENKAQKQARTEREIAKRRKRGEAFEQLTVESKRGAVAGTFWGNAWCQNLEAYSDYESRLPRGRTYLRGGNVYDLGIEPGEIFAYVTGSEIYEVLIRIDPVSVAQWERVKEACAGKIGTLLDLLGGKLGPSVMEVMTDLDGGLFPKPREIHLSCSCPDWAEMCKHVAAVLYGVGVQLDTAPELLFKLRKIDHRELISQAAENAGAVSDAIEAPGADVLAAEDLSGLFGIEISEPEAAFLDP